MEEEMVLWKMYALFNVREMEALLALMAEDVIWANAMEGGHEQGREAVRAYWTRQWAMVDPHVEPMSMALGEYGAWVVAVHQVVRDLEGKVLADLMVEHGFQLEGGLVKRFDVR